MNTEKENNYKIITLITLCDCARRDTVAQTVCIQLSSYQSNHRMFGVVK